MNDLEKMLGEFFDSADEAELSALGVFPDERLDRAASARILSSAERKAGINMNKTKENITVKRTGRHSRRFVGAVIAAAVLATGAVGAGAYAISQFVHKENVELYMGEQAADKLENIGLALNEVRENEHVRVTADTVLSDGMNAHIIFTVDKLDDAAREQLTEIPEMDIYYADTGKDVQPRGINGYSRHSEMNEPFDDTFAFRVEIIADGTEYYSPTAPLTVSFCPKYFDGEKLIPIEPNLYDGIEFEFDLSKNVDTVVLTAEDGRELIMSPFGVSGYDIPSDEDHWRDPDCIFMIRTDGSREPFTGHGMTSGGSETSGYSSIFVESFYDLDDYIGIEIYGVKYLRQ